MSETLMHMSNYMEYVVECLVDSVIRDLGVCKCQKCRLGIVAMALNSLAPKYVVTENGRLYTKANSFQQQFEVDALSAITNAAIKVKEKPRHE